MFPSNNRISRSYLTTLAVTALLLFTFSCIWLVQPAHAGQGIVTGSVLNIRSGPSSSADTIGSLLKDSQVEVLESSGDWFKIKYNNLQGWVASTYISTATNNTSTVLANNRQIQVVNGPINVRSGPGTTFSILATIADQAIYKIIHEQDGWYQIQLQDGQTAYVAGWLVQELSTNAAAPGRTVTTAKAKTTASEDAVPSVVLNQKTMQFEVPPRIENGRTLVPLRAIFEAMEANVEWNESTRTVTARNASTTVVLPLDSTRPTVNGQVWTLEAAAKIVNGRTLAPLRFVGEAFGGKVNWDAQKRMITILYTPAEQPTVVKVKEAKVNLRQSPLASAAAVDTAVYGETMAVLKQQDSWYQVKHGGITAWVASWVVESVSAAENPGTSPGVPQTPASPETPSQDPIVDTPTPIPAENNEPENALHLSRSRDSSGIKITISSKVKMAADVKQSSGSIQYQFVGRPLVGLNYFEEAAGVHFIKGKASSKGQDTLINLDFPTELGYKLSVEEDGKKLVAFFPNTLLSLEKSTFGSVGDRFIITTLCPITYTGKLNGDKLEVKIPNLLAKKGTNYNYSSDLLSSLKVEANPSKPSDLLITFNTSNLGKYSFAASGKNADLNIILMKKVAAPVRQELVVLDAGHGGNDTGARGSQLDEKEVNLAVVLKAGELLKQKGIKVEFTRTADSTVGLEERSIIANQFNAAIFISVHSNASTQSAPNGTETYFYAPLESPNLYMQRDERNDLATMLQSQLTSRLQRTNRGVKEANFSVLRNTQMPSALIEMAFISNPDEQALLMDDNFRNQAALAIANAVEDYMNKY